MLAFLKLGGSLITDKNRPQTANLTVIQRLADEINRGLHQNPELRLVIGHGSGSFGHTAAKKYNTRQGVSSSKDWVGFVEVWRQARNLNEIILSAFYKADLPVIGFPPSAWLVSDKCKPFQVFPEPIKAALASNLIPVINGDVIFDARQGGTIFSTEDAFLALVPFLHPSRVYLCGLEPGVWEDFPDCTRIIEHIHPGQRLTNLAGSSAVDVTGGMAEKVRLMENWVNDNAELQARIFSGVKPDNLTDILIGKPIGTLISQ